MTNAQVFIRVELLRKQAATAKKVGLKGAAADYEKEINKVLSLAGV
jgi:hypothetical protein